MQHVTRREVPEPMTWARALVLAVGLFFATAILLGQLPGYVYTVSTLAKLTSFEAGFFSLGLLFVGLGVLGMVILYLYDPKPIIPPVLVTGVGIVLMAVGVIVLLYATATGITTFPLSTTGIIPLLGGQFLWFEPGDIDLVALGMIAFGIGGSIAMYGVLAPAAARKQLNGARLQFLALVMGGIAAVMLAAYVVFYTFFVQNPQTSPPTLVYPGGAGILASSVANVWLGAAVFLSFLAVQLWFLPVMLADRRRYMPGLYLISVLGFVALGVVCLVAWIAVYPVVYGIHLVDTQDLFVVCAQKTQIPASCTFTPYLGYIIDGVVTGNFFVLGLMAIYFWHSHRQAVILGAAETILATGLAVIVVHTQAAGLPVSLFLGGAVLILALTWIYATQRQIGRAGTHNLGCTGQWLVVGTCLLVYLTGFSFFSLAGNNLFEVENLGVTFLPGKQFDAFWAMLITGSLAAVQFFFLMRRGYKA
jgi:hypothetical protein